MSTSTYPNTASASRLNGKDITRVPLVINEHREFIAPFMAHDASIEFKPGAPQAQHVGLRLGDWSQIGAKEG